MLLFLLWQLIIICLLVIATSNKIADFFDDSNTICSRLSPSLSPSLHLFPASHTNTKFYDLRTWKNFWRWENNNNTLLSVIVKDISTIFSTPQRHGRVWLTLGLSLILLCLAHIRSLQTRYRLIVSVSNEDKNHWVSRKYVSLPCD